MSNFTIPCYTIINANFDPTPMLGEEFKPVPDYPGYEVSDFGRVVSLKSGRPRVLKGDRSAEGYLRVKLYRDCKGKTRRVHVLVAQAHLGPAPSDKPLVLHANDISGDNHLSNLRYGTASENSRDKVLNGNDPYASKTHCPQGHAYVAANTRVGTRGRICITCHSARGVASRAKKMGRTHDFNEIADKKYIELTNAPGADLTPVLSKLLAPAENLRLRDRVLSGGSLESNKTHCKHGHDFVAANTTSVRNGERVCMSCRCARNAAYRAKKSGRDFNFNEYADRKFLELTTAPGADLTPILSASLARAANDNVAA